MTIKSPPQKLQSKELLCTPTKLSFKSFSAESLSPSCFKRLSSTEETKTLNNVMLISDSPDGNRNCDSEASDEAAAKSHMYFSEFHRAVVRNCEGKADVEVASMTNGPGGFWIGTFPDGEQF